MPRKTPTPQPAPDAEDATGQDEADAQDLILDITDLAAPPRRALRVFGERLEMLNVDELSPLEYAHLEAKRARIGFLVATQAMDRPPRAADIAEVERLAVDIIRATVPGFTDEMLERMSAGGRRRDMEKAAVAVAFFARPQELTRSALMARVLLSIGARSMPASPPPTAPPPAPAATGSTSPSNGSRPD